MRSGNPALNDNIFAGPRSYDAASAMTIQGTTNKCFFLLFLLVLSASWVWSNPTQLMPLYMPALIIGFVLAMVTIFKKEWAVVTAPMYAIVQGVLLGGISLLFESSYPGIVKQAMGLTFGTLFALLLAYKSRLINVTANFRLGVVAATGGIAIYYFISLIMGFWGKSMPLIYDSGPFGIAFSAVVVIIAALNLVLDFDFIEQGARAGAPKYMEWYGAFGLIVTLIWLYLEILRLLSKTRQR